MRSSILFLFLVFLVNACAQNSISNRVPFSIDPEERKIAIPVRLNDSAIANMTFDTGAGLDCFVLDYNWLQDHPSCIPADIIPDTTGYKPVWLHVGTGALEYPEYHRKVVIGNTELFYNHLLSTNWKNYLSATTDGLFNIPEQDTTHIWEFNFDNNYLEIHPANRFKMPKNCFVLDIEKKENSYYPFYITIPMHIRTSDGDTLTMNFQYCIDSALPEDICFFSDTEPEFFSNRKDVVWTMAPKGYKRHSTVSATLFDGFSMDSLRIYTYSRGVISEKFNCLIGQNFLKRFNVFFDMKNQQIGLQPVKNFQRVVNPTYYRFYYQSNINQEGKTIVDFIADYKENFLKMPVYR